MKIGVAKETAPGERRVALVPETLGKLKSPGLEVLVEHGAGDGSSIPDQAYTDAGATIVSTDDLYAQSDVNAAQARAGDTLLALEAEGSPLHLDHGYPVRLIAPNRPGVLQTKWVSRIVIA